MRSPRKLANAPAARAITSHGPQRLTRGSDHDHRPAKESFHALRITSLNKQLAITVPDARAGRKGAGSDPGPGRRRGSGAARVPAGRAALPRAAGFWLVAGVLFLLLFVSGAASPLYDVYQAQWRFSAT